MAQARIEHGDQNPGCDRMIKPVADQVDDVHQMLHALHGEPACLDGDHDLVAGADRVDRQEAQARRAVDDDVIIRVTQRGNDLGQFHLTADLIRQLLLERADQDV